MKLNVFPLCLFVLFSLANCNTISPEGNTSNCFESLGNDDAFMKKHALADDQESEIRGEWVEFESNGKKARAYVVSPEVKSNQYLLLFHEWWGLNSHIQLEADKWQEKLKKVNVIALDLYDGKVAENREEATEFMQAAKSERIYEIIDVALANLPKENMLLCTMGWCFGGGWALKASIRAEERSVATVMYYGMPIQEINELQKIAGDVLFIYGTQDQWINSEVAQKFQENMLKAYKEVNILAYEADHAFANPSNAHFDKEAANEAGTQVLRYLNSKY